MKTLSIDPSSTCVGWALFDGADTPTKSGRIKPKDRYLAWPRIVFIVREVRALCLNNSIDPSDQVVVEVSGGKVHGAIRERCKGSNLAIYGEAVGAVCWELCQHVHAGDLERVEANEWTRGREKKKRQAELALTVPGYDPAKDPGADQADAIGLGMWWLQEQRLREAVTP